MKIQLTRALLFNSLLRKAFPNGFLFESVANGGIPANIATPDLQMGFNCEAQNLENLFFSLEIIKSRNPWPCSPRGVATRSGKRRIFSRDCFRWERQNAFNR